jgi:hypothetical protein
VTVLAGLVAVFDAVLLAGLAAALGAALVTVLAMSVSPKKESMTAKTYNKNEFAGLSI